MSVRIDSTVCFHTLSDDIERPLTFGPGFFLTSRRALCPLGVPLDAATIYSGPAHLVRLAFLPTLPSGLETDQNIFQHGHSVHDGRPETRFLRVQSVHCRQRQRPCPVGDPR